MKINLNEDTRQQLLYKSKSSVKGNQRFKRRLKSKIANSVKEFNSIDMNQLFKEGILTVNIKVNGETDNYIVKIKFGGFLDLLHEELAINNYVLNSKVITRTLIKGFNREDTYIFCSCLHPTTKIKLLDGTNPTVAELKERFDKNEKLYVYSVDEKGDFKPGEVEKVWITNYATNFIKIILDNDKEILTTPDHLYMCRDGTYCQAQYLTVGQSLMPLYFNSYKGYEIIKYNSIAKKYQSTYKLVAEYFYKNIIQDVQQEAEKINKLPLGVAIHHKDFNKNNNNPENLQIMTAFNHWNYHANEVGFKRLWQNEEWRKNAQLRASKNMSKLNKNPSQKMINARIETGRKNSKILNSAENIAKYHDLRSNTIKQTQPWKLNQESRKLKQQQKINNGCFKTEKFIETRKKEGYKLFTNPENQRKMLYNRPLKTLQYLIENKLELTEENYDKFKRKTDPHIKTLFKSIDAAIEYYQLNHKVKAIEHVIIDKTPVYDIKVKNYHNFCTEAGVILHNCPDFFYRFGYWTTKTDINSGEPQNIPSNITNPNNTLGSACKHVLLALNNNQWILKVAAVIYNYINYMKIHYKKLYADVIYPAIYEKPYTEEDIQLTLFDNDIKIATDKDTDEIDKVNDEARNRPLFKKGNTQGIRFASNKDENEDQLKLDI